MQTPRQQRALDTSRHLCVTANAGSGKTRVLVERYVSLLLSGQASPGDLVALTYTDKAASELKRKIAERITEAIAHERDPAVKVHLEEVREGLASASIGTIHAFCSRLLREHPVEAGIDAAFSVIEGLDQQTMLQEAVKESFQASLRGDRTRARSAALADAVAKLGKQRVLACITTMVEKRETVRRLTGAGGLYSRPDEEILSVWQEELDARLQSELSDPAFLLDLERVVGVAMGKTAEDVRKEFIRFAHEPALRPRMETLAHLTELMFTKELDLRKSFSGGKEVETEFGDETARIAARWVALAPLVRVSLDRSAEHRHRSMLATTRLLLEVFRDVLARYGRMKAEVGRLDYEDLLVLTRDLLGNPEVSTRLARRFKFIMVDEYQDTNRLQYELLLPLVNGLRSGNLFIVGDPKQSIYGFRNADVAVFEQTRADVQRVGGPPSEITLEESFRPLRDLAAFVNLVFSRIMTAGRNFAYEVAYDPLVQARQNRDPGRVELLLSGNAEEPAVTEVDMIARRILGLIAARLTVCMEDEGPREIRFSDIAVLLRSRAMLPSLEEALVRHRVPYVVSAGVGYFQSQDILDFYNYLQFLLNPGNDVALAGILRSPFFGISDAELFQISRSGTGGSLWERVRSNRPPLPPVARATAMLEDDLLAGRRLTLPDLINRISGRTLFPGKIAGTARGEQAAANFEKLIAMARSYDAQGFTTLAEFVSRLKQLVDEEKKEGQGIIEHADDTVQVMTIHSAKGLEFPVVILPFLDRPFGQDDEPFLDDSYGIAFGPGGEGEGDPPLLDLLRNTNARKTIAEEKRIFYVACTRARDMLILSGDPAVGKRSVSCMGWLLDALGEEHPRAPGTLNFTMRTDCLNLESGQFVPVTVEHVLSVHLVSPSDLPGVDRARKETAGKRILPELMIAPLRTRQRGEIYSASKIRTYLECPAKYYHQYALGLPSGGGPFAWGDDEDLKDRESPAELRGRIFHSMMAAADALTENPSRLLEEARRAFALEAPFGFRTPDQVINDAARLVQAVISSAAWGSIARGTESRTEYTISTSFGDDFLTGTMDRVYRDTDGIWTVLDYKTDSVDRGLIAQRGMLYWPQLEFYGYLVHRYHGADRVRLLLLFTTTPDNVLHKELSSAELEQFGQSLGEVISRIRRSDFASKSPHCRDCPFQASECPPL